MLLCLPSSHFFSLASPPTCVFAPSPQIEDGGKAALCKKLKVGDELININGSALYGSRQEALILIKGSYRILKLTVRRWALSNNVNRMHKHTRSYLRICFVRALSWLQRMYLSVCLRKNRMSFSFLPTPHVIMAMTYSSWKEGEAGGRREVWPSVCLTCKHAPRLPRCFTGSNLSPLGCHTESWLW